MSGLMEEVMTRARRLAVPFSAHVDLTWRCNEQCVHCYLDHGDCGEMKTFEVLRLLDELAEAGCLILALSGGELFLRRDLLEIVAQARARTFAVRLKTNATLIREREADRIRALGVEDVQVSIYSDRPEVHDAVTLLPGSLERSLRGMRLLRDRGQKVTIAHMVMRPNRRDYAGVRRIAQELGATFRIDPTITPKLNGDYSPVGLNVTHEELVQIVRNPEFVGNVDEFCAAPAPADEAALNEIPCSAGYNHAYVSPYGDVYPCVQLPLECGNVRKKRFGEIWRESEGMRKMRLIRMRDLPVCAGCSHVAICSRCPGLALMEGDLRGPSLADCEKSYARTGQVPTGYRVPETV
jgi:AdoMet-dependent heme synthase